MCNLGVHTTQACAVTPGYRDIGISGHRDIGTSGYRDIGILGHLDIWISGYQDIGISGYWDTGILGRRDIGISGYEGLEPIGSSPDAASNLMCESRLDIVDESTRTPLNANAGLAVGHHHTLAPPSCESPGCTQYTVVPLPLLERSVPWLNSTRCLQPHLWFMVSCSIQLCLYPPFESEIQCPLGHCHPLLSA